jgi:hypothetical protein
VGCGFYGVLGGSEDRCIKSAVFNQRSALFVTPAERSRGQLGLTLDAPRVIEMTQVDGGIRRAESMCVHGTQE